jgi:hypothetical protein
MLAVKDIPGLVAHWPLDEGSGATTAEATGKLPAAAISGASWTTGRSGAALRFDGGDTFVLLPNAPALRQISNGSCTITAWFQPEDVPSGSGEANNAFYGIVIRNGMHQGLFFTSGSAFVFGHWLGEDYATRSQAGAGSKPYPPGAFYHLAGGIDRAAGKMFFYVNGRLESTSRSIPRRNPGTLGQSMALGHRRASSSEMAMVRQGRHRRCPLLQSRADGARDRRHLSQRRPGGGREGSARRCAPLEAGLRRKVVGIH